MIAFNRPFLYNNELAYIQDAVHSDHLSGDGKFTHLCHQFFEEHYQFLKVQLTHSCTAALEMTAILTQIQAGDEVIMPSYTFVSTANAFELRGAVIRFVDSCPDRPHLDPDLLEELITPRTKAVVVVHYAGVACDMDPILELAKKHQFYVIEDAAQAIDSRYKGKILGSLGDFGTLSFHETKNIIAGEGGLLCINRAQFIQRAEIIREKGTNRSSFFRGEVNKYGWVDIGSSYLPSDLIGAYLYGQLEGLSEIQAKRAKIWRFYAESLSDLAEKGYFELPVIPDYATHNHHIFYLICHHLKDRQGLIKYLREHQINAVFHYLPLHDSPYFKAKHDGRDLKHAVRYADCLIRLPNYYLLSLAEAQQVSDAIRSYYTAC